MAKNVFQSRAMAKSGFRTVVTCNDAKPPSELSSFHPFNTRQKRRQKVKDEDRPSGPGSIASNATCFSFFICFLFPVSDTYFLDTAPHDAIRKDRGYYSSRLSSTVFPYDEQGSTVFYCIFVQRGGFLPPLLSSAAFSCNEEGLPLLIRLSLSFHTSSFLFSFLFSFFQVVNFPSSHPIKFTCTTFWCSRSFPIAIILDDFARDHLFVRLSWILGLCRDLVPIHPYRSSTPLLGFSSLPSSVWRTLGFVSGSAIVVYLRFAVASRSRFLTLRRTRLSLAPSFSCLASERKSRRRKLFSSLRSALCDSTIDLRPKFLSRF